MDFCQPAMSSPAEESHYAKKLFKELKQARQLAQKCSFKAQWSLKYHYYKSSEESAI